MDSIFVQILIVHIKLHLVNVLEANLIWLLAF